ncbi:MAG: hypothetical protein FJX72_03975 [Armatimonadetes bacterium]|nr:hypothetical protein [Armatimonadota bacterium]
MGRRWATALVVPALLAPCGCGWANEDTANRRALRVEQPTDDIRRVLRVAILGLDRSIESRRAIWAGALAQAQARGIEITDDEAVLTRTGAPRPDAVAVITPADAGLTPSLRAARARGIPVFAVGETAPVGVCAARIAHGSAKPAVVGAAMVNAITDYLRGANIPDVVRADERGP